MERVIASQRPRTDVPMTPLINAELIRDREAWQKEAWAAYKSAIIAVDDDNDAIEQWLYDSSRPTPRTVSAVLAIDPTIKAHLRTLLARGIPATSMDCEIVARSCLYAARSAADPAVSLNDLDALQAAGGYPQDDAQLMFIRLIGQCRDQAYLIAAINGTLTNAAFSRWAATPDDSRGRLEIGLEGERLHGKPTLDREYLADPCGYIRDFGWSRFGEWWYLPENLDRDLTVLAREEELVASGAYPTPGQMSWPYKIGDRLRDYLRVAACHRMAVLAAHILALRAERGELPTDAGNFASLSIDLSSGPDRAELAYHRFDSQSFALYYQPSAQDPFATALPIDSATITEATPHDHTIWSQGLTLIIARSATTVGTR